MNRSLLAATAACALAVSSPAWAANIGLTIWNTANPGGAVTATGTDNVIISTENLNGVTVEGSLGTRVTTPFNEINGAQFLIDNTTTSSQTVELAVGAVGYVGPDGKYHQSATINLQNGSADLAGGFFVDALNRQGGISPVFPAFGVENTMFDSGSLSGPQAFSFNDLALTPNSGKLFSMGETLTLTLGAGAIVGVQGISQTASAIPELPTWAMALGGFGFFGLLGLRRQRSQRAAFAG
jgi:hypothetical protein